MVDPLDPPRPPLTGAQALALAHFMRQTAHLTPEERDRVMATAAAASQQRAARVEATDAINNAAGTQVIPTTTTYAIEPERISQGPDFDAIAMGRSTHSPMPPYTVDPRRSRRKPGPSGSK